MQRFWRENWIWIVAPIVLVAVALIACAIYFGSDTSAPFIYPV